MEPKIDDEIFDALLYISRLSTTPQEKQELMPQLQQIVKGMEILRDHVEDSNFLGASKNESELRSNDIVKTLEAQDLKKNSKEYVDGYFRVPKVFGES